MQWFILSRDLHVLCVPSSDSKDSLPIFNDKQTIVLQNNTVVSTYDFSVQQKHPDAINLKWGNYVVFRDKYGKTRMYTLISHDGDDLTQTWHAEDIGLDLLNETADKWDYTGELHGIDWYFNNLVLKDTGWSIGINEISNLTRGLKFDGQSDTQLKRLGDIANQFDGAEIDFEVDLDGSRVTKQVINIYRKVGNSMTQQRFIDAVNLKSLQSSGSIEDLCTAMIGYGSQPDTKDGENAEDVPPIDFADLNYDDGQFFSPKGDKAVYDRLNHLVWSRYSGFDTTNQNETKGYITGIYNYETKDPNELLNRTITQVKKRNAPSETYEANLLDINADIGDEVQIAHNNYNPPIYLSARVESVTNCYTASGQDTGILGDYQKLESQIDPRIKEMIDQLADQIKPNYTWLRYAKDDKGTGMTSRPTADTKYVAIVSNKPTGVPSDNPADYAGHWQLIQGEGPEGIPGPKGEDGKTSYTHFAYANNVSGTKDFSTSDPTGRSYMGVYSDFTKADSNNPSDYVWLYTKGETGPEGMQGLQGLQGATGNQGIQGPKGLDGKSSYTHIAYGTSNSGAGFTQTPSTSTTYIGMYVDQTATDSTDPTKYAWSLIKGHDGANGAPGKAGADGKTPYFHQAWADSQDGKTNFSTTISIGKKYLGTYTDYVAADSTDPTIYKWTELVGAIEIGGRNLIHDTSFDRGMWHNIWNNPTMSITSDGNLKFTIPDTNQAGVGVTAESLEMGIYTLTAKVRGHGQLQPYVMYWDIGNYGLYDSNGTPYPMINSDTDFVNIRYTFNLKFKDPAKQYAFAILTTAAAGNWLEIKKNSLKLERGNKPTDWSPAPEDTQGQIDKVNSGLAETNSKIAAVTKVDSQATAPTNPKKGDQWWVKDANGNINAFKIWDGTKWADSIIQQSAMNISTLNGNTINGAVINGSKFTSNFSQEYTGNVKDGPLLEGVQTIGNGSYTVDYKVKGTKAQRGYTQIQPDGLVSYITDEDGNVQALGSLLQGSFYSMNKNGSGYLTPEDLIRIGPESWSNSDAGGTYTIAFERRWGRVWVTGEILLPTSAFGDYHTLFTIKTPGLRPQKNRWFVGMRTGNVPVAGEIEMRPNGEFVVIGVPQGGRHTFEGVSYSLGNE
ncbi:phage tail protein [Latilactobacillus curvatus]|uniref:phage tail spike protein n=1 Tax=Latilactobacillus curvatus TaxID=28038 RepID=UPI001C007A54|nr:phage tail spike protein [Latilactobacillus curvatus]QWF35081.1 phage tail protein [Latilactobacillus curvatus]